MSKLKEATESLDADDISHLNIMHKQIEAFRSTVEISSMKYLFVKSCVRCKKVSLPLLHYKFSIFLQLQLLARRGCCITLNSFRCSTNLTISLSHKESSDAALWLPFCLRSSMLEVKQRISCSRRLKPRVLQEL